MTKLTKESIEKAPNNKPVVYTITNKNNEILYVGSSKRGEVQNRLEHHRKNIPGATNFSLRQYSSIKDAQAAEERKIRQERPPHNKNFT